MIVRILENFGGYLVGVHDVPHKLAIELISKGIAVKGSEKAVDNEALNALKQATERNATQE